MFTKPQCMLGLMLDVGDGRREEALPQKLQVGVGQWAWEGRGVKGGVSQGPGFPWTSWEQEPQILPLCSWMRSASVSRT